MKKGLYIVLALSAMVLWGCSGAGSKDASQEASSQEPVSQEAAQDSVPLIPMARATADDLPPVVLEGEGYHVEIPADEEGIECTPVSEAREAELRQQGYEFIAKPIHVTRNGDNHVELKSAATVRIAIPEDYPKDKYDELVGVLISDNGAEYKIPDYDALREGYVQFQTCHFSDISAEQKQYELREQFIEKVAVNGWGRNMNNKQVEPKLRDQLDKFAFDFYLGKEDLIGIAMREVFGDNDIVKIGLDIVNAYDLEVATFEQRAEVASQTMVRVAESKLLAYFLDKLKEEETKKIRVEDELRSEKIGEKVYKTEMAEIESKRNKIIGVLEDHFGIDNVEQVSTMVGKQASTEEWFIYACEYIGKFALDKWKETVVNMVPYIGYLQQMATAVEIWKKFWAATEMQTLYEYYKNRADEQGGALLGPTDWNTVSMMVTAPEFLHGMKDEKIKEMIEKRYLEQRAIEQRKVELREYLAIIESTVNMNHPLFLLKNFDYVQRLTVINNLMDRFRSELVTKDGYLYCYENGEMKQLIHPHAVNRQLCEVVSRYLDFYPDRDAFNEWMSKNGYNYDPLKQRFKRLDALLWNEKAQKEPDIHIVIQESMGAESGIPKYMNHTVCLGKDGKPYKKWYRDIPDNDTIRYEGWAVEYPDEDEYIKLSAYDALGWPNQVLIYGNTGDMLLGKKPVKIVPFEVDTTNSSTYVELNEDAVVLTDFYHNRIGSADGVYYPHSVMGPDGKEIYLDWTTMTEAALNNALEDVHIFINLYGKNNNFSFSVSGSCDDNGESAEIELTVSGHMGFDKKNEYAKNVEVGTCAIKGTMSGVNRQGVQIKCRFNLTGKIFTNGWKNGENYHIKCRATGPLEYEGVNTKGKRKAATVEGSSTITFHEYYDPHAYEDDEEE